MFDPTAYENIKVVLEGAVYDFDLEGVVSVLDRNDTFNLSKLTRTFTIRFGLSGSEINLQAMISLSTQDLYKEVALNKEDVGCVVQISFFIQEPNVPLHKVREQMISIWGERDIDLKTEYSLVKDETKTFVTIEFDRLIKEEHVDDIVALVEHCIHTLRIIQMR